MNITKYFMKLALIAGAVFTFSMQAQAMTCVNYEDDITNGSGLALIAQEEGITYGTLYGLRDGESIQNVLDTCNDSPANPVTIILFPGSYDSFSMINNDRLKRYINIIGTEKKDVTVTDNSGQYDHPAAEIYTDGIIKNVTFISTLKDIKSSSSQTPAYAVHLDYGQVDITFDNCDFIAYNAPALGIGLVEGTTVTLKNCLMKLYTDTDTDVSFGYINALYCHTSDYFSNTSNQRLELYNCTVDALSSNGFAMVLQEINDNQGVLKSVDSNYKSIHRNGIDFGGFEIDKDSTGNNVSALNLKVEG